MTRSEMMLLRALLNRFKAHMEKEEEPHSVEHEALEVDILNVCGDLYMLPETDEPLIRRQAI